jgi:hypothetical protein
MTTNNARGMAENKLLSFKVRHYCYLNTPSGPHVVVASDGLAVAHEAEVHGRADKVADEGEVHATHGEKGAGMVMTASTYLSFRSRDLTRARRSARPHEG